MSLSGCLAFEEQSDETCVYDPSDCNFLVDRLFRDIGGWRDYLCDGRRSGIGCFWISKELKRGLVRVIYDGN